MKFLQTVLIVLAQLNKNDVKVSIEYSQRSLTFSIKKNAWCGFYDVSFSEKECKEINDFDIIRILKENIRDIEKFEKNRA